MKATILGSLILATFVANAVQTNAVISGVSNWNLKESYSDGRIPSEGDVVEIPDGATVTLNGDDADSCLIVSKLSQLVPRGTVGSTIVFNIGKNCSVTIDAAIYKYDDEGVSGEGSGIVVKRGEGELVLGSKGRIKTNLNARKDYYVRAFNIEEGTLRLPQGVPMGEYYYGAMNISRGAKLCLSYYLAGESTSTAYYHSFWGLSGEGDVVYDGPASTGRQEYFRVEDAYCTFAGRIIGNCGIYPRARIMLSGTNSTMTLNPVAYGNRNNLSSGYGTIGVMKIGCTGEESSVGTGDALTMGYRGGGYLYLGAGEVTDKKILVSSDTADGPAFFDAGATGGITFLNTWTYSASSTPRMFDIVLMGTNAQPCTIAGKIKDWRVGTTNLAFYITKKGSGIWRFKDAATRRWTWQTNVWRLEDDTDLFWSGGLGVEEGTVAFDSMEETNVVCSLGFARILQTPYRETYNEEKNVDYAYVLGETNSMGVAATEGTLEYMGTNGVAVGTRRTVLKGHGRFKVESNTARFRYAGVSALTEGGHTLTLDGSAENGNEVLDVSDGVGSVSVVKEGKGEWTVGGRSSFSGKLAVDAGTLNVRPASTNYTWFMFRVKQLVAGAEGYGTTAELELQQFGLFDAAGNRLGRDLAYTEKYWEINPGEIAFGSRDPVIIDGAGRGPEKLFDYNNTSTVLYAPRKNDWQLKPDDPDKWITFLFRLPEGSAPVASYDLVARYARSSVNYACRTPRTFSLYGSTDGIHWEVLDEVADVLSDDANENGGFCVPTAEYRWMHSNTTYVQNEAYMSGRTIRGYSTSPVIAPSPSSLSVAGGASLNVTGVSLVVSKLEIDAGRGFGEMNGCVFTKEGEVLVTGLVGRPKEVVLGDVPSDTSGFWNVIGWTLSVNGDTTSNYLLVVSDGKLKLVKKGLVIIFR